MYLIIGENNKVICVSETLDHQENGNPLVKNGTLAIASILVKQEISGVTSIPTDYEDGKYCYIDGVFSISPDWRIYISDAQRIADLEAAVSALMEV
jgi:hypothetical protein